MSQPTRYILRNDQIKANALQALQQTECDPDKPKMVEIKEFKSKRSLAQNRLQMQWCKEAAEQGDQTAEEYRAFCKLHFGVPILREDPDFQCKYDETVKPLPYETKLALMAEPFDFPVTRLMHVPQMRRYLDAIYQHFTGLGFQLTDPNWQGMEVAA